MGLNLLPNGLPAEIAARVARAKRVVFVSGNFNVIHPGHLRLLTFARECGDFLLVGVTADDQLGVFVPQSLRLEGVQAISSVDHAIPLPGPVEDFISTLKPNIVVKGKEHESHFNLELPILEGYGGKLIFGSGEVRFSSLELLQRELRQTNLSRILNPSDFQRRHGFDNRRLAELLDSFSSLRVLVVGDLIVDEYITCDPLGMSREDPTIVVTPIKSDKFVGGAGIVAAHAAGLGAKATYFGVTGNDQTADFARETLLGYGVMPYLLEDESRPTTLKQRYRASGKTLLRVSQLRQHEISRELIDQMLESMGSVLSETDLVVFSDFNYGCLPQALVDEIVTRCVQRGIPMVADSQSSSQLGDVSRFSGMLLITPTEHEARLAMRDHVSGLAVLANALQNKTRAKHVFITLGAEGVLVHGADDYGHRVVTDQLPAFNSAPIDVSGAGDCLLICAALSMVSGGSVWEGAYLGSVVAACQVSRLGNTPLTAAEVRHELAP